MLIDNLYNAGDKINISLAKGHIVKVIGTNEIKSVAELYKNIHNELKKGNCQKFIHKLEEKDIEEIVEDKSSEIVGYFKNGKLAGALYTKPFAKSSHYFKTPSYEGDKTTQAIGGLVVDAKSRGNGVVSKILTTAVAGVKEYAQNENSNICGLGVEISSENFASARSFAAVKDKNGNPVFNLVGTHYICDTDGKHKDVTILGYNSFGALQEDVNLKQVPLNGNQEMNYAMLHQGLKSMGNGHGGINTSEIDGHTIETLNSYIYDPLKDVLDYDPLYTLFYPPHLKEEHISENFLQMHSGLQLPEGN